MESLTPTVVLASFAAIYAVTKGIKFFSSRATAANRRAELSLRAKKKRELRDMLRVKYAAIIKAYLHSRKSHLGSTRQVEIAHMTAQEIATSIHAGTLKAADAVAVFASRCIVAGKKLDIIAEELYTVGLEEAEKLDDNIDTYKNDNTKILLGVPISIKDHIDIEGYDSTCGLAVRCFDPAAEDAVVVKLLRQAGAIPIVRGNVPQCIMLPESDNLIWGQSKNPWNAKKTAGGSSGGDAALVSSRAIPISIGSDIGGSIRIPAHCCGVYGFKPTPGRISYKGCTVARPSRFDGQIAIRCTSGPLANRVEDLALVMKAWLVPEMSRLDPTTPMTGFDHDLYEGKTRTFSTFDARLPITSTQTETPAVTTESKTKLKVGYFVYDGYTDVAKTGERAVDETLIALKAAGHEVVPFTPPSIDDAVGLYLSILGADGGLRGFFDGLEGETLHSMYDEVYKVASLPDFLRPLVSTIFNCIGEKRSADLVSRVSYKSAYDHWDDITGLLAYTKLFTDQWTALGLDAVVCPGLHVPAFNHNGSGNVLPLFVSCFLWNVLHYPVGAVPITHVLPNEDDYLSIAKIKDRLSHFAHGSMQASEGLPYGIQVACLPNHDELVLRVMKDIQDQLIIQESSSNVRADSKQTKFISPFAQKLDALDFAED